MAASRLGNWLEGYRWRAGLEPERRERRVITGLGLFCISLGSIIGSGWGFAPLAAAQIAGPAALLSWAVVLTVVVVFAMVHAELGSMFFASGGSACFPLPAFGSLVSTLTWWLYFMNGVPTAGIEVSAVLAFATPYVPQLTAGSPPALTGVGFGIALVLMAVLLLVNVIGVGFLARVNGGLVLAKIVLLGGSMFVLLSSSGHLENLAPRGFFVMGVPAVLTAAATSGIMFALLGSEQAVQFGAETASGSRRRLPSAVIWSLVAAFVLYAFLQIAFTATVDPAWVRSGWGGIQKHFPDPRLTVPFSALAQSAGEGWLAAVIVLVMLLSPLGTAGLYLATAGRTNLAMARIRNLGPLTLMTESGIPLLAILLAFGLACCLLLPFPSWQTLVAFTTKATVAGYGFQTLALGALRRQLPDRRRPYRLRWARLLAPVGFVFANEMIMFGGWDDNLKLGVAIVIGIALAVALRRLPGASPLDLSGAVWVVPYLLGVGAVSYLSAHEFGGLGILPFGVDVLAMAAVSVGIYQLAMWSRLPSERAGAYAAQLSGPLDERVAPPAGEGQEAAVATIS